MDWKDLYIESFESTLRVLERVLDGLTPEDLNWQPRADCNSIGWTTWHLARALDGMMSSISGDEELWTKNGWHSKFNRPADAMDTGYAHTTEQVAAFQCPDIDILLSYYRATLEKTRSQLTTLSSADLDRKVDDFISQVFPTVGSRIIGILEELLLHAGQITYIRGLKSGKGWQDF